MPNIKIKNLTASYVDKNKNKTPVFENFNADFDDAKINVIVGPSGCGKTTLIKCLCQQLDYEGEIFFDDVNIQTLDTRKMNIGYINQSFVLYPKMTVFENIAFPLSQQRMHPDDINYLVRCIAKKLGLTACLTRLPKEISIGQQQRVAIARALVKQPKVCFFDEALTNLDKPLAQEIRMILKKFLSEYKCTSIYVTHDFTEAMALSDKIYVINDKKIEVSGTPKEIFEMGGTPQELFDSGNETIEFLKKSYLVEGKSNYGLNK